MARLQETTAPTTPTGPARAWGAGVSGTDVELGPAVAPTRERLPALERSPLFVLAAHPGSWTLQQDSRGAWHLVPRLRTVPLDPGVGGVDVAADRRTPVYGQALQRLRDRGWTIIPPDVDRHLGHASYIRRVEVEGGYAHMTRWETAYVGERSTRRDDDAYLAWCGELLTRGLVAPPSQMVVHGLRERLARELQRVQATISEGRGTDRARSDEAMMRAQLARLAELLGEHQAAPAPAAPASAEAVGLDLTGAADEAPPVEPTIAPAGRRRGAEAAP